MSTNEGAATKSRGKDGCVNPMNVRLTAQVGATTSVTGGRPRFHNHTQSSLLKRKEPVRPRRRLSSTSVVADVLQKSRRNVAPLSRLSGVSKKCRATKQSKSMHALKTIIKREKDRQSFDSLRGDSEQMTSRRGRRIGNSLVFLQHDLINNVSCDFKKHMGSSSGLIFLQDETPEFVDRLEEGTEDMRASRHGDRTRYVSHDTQRCIASPSRNGRNFSKDRSIAEISHELQQTNDDDDKNTRCEVEVLHRGAKHRGSGNRPQSVSSYEYRPVETQIREQVRSTDLHSMMIHKRTRTEQKIWMNRKATGRSEEVVDVDRINSRGNVKFMKHADRTRGKDTRSLMNSKTVSCQKNHGLQKKEHSSVERVGSFNRQSKNTSICPRQAKVLMKENRNPPVNRVAKFCKQLTEPKQSGGTLPNRRQSLTKVVCFPSSNLPKKNGSKISVKGNGAKSIRSRSRSKSRSSYLRQEQSITPKRLSRTRDNNDHCHVELIAVCKRSSERSNMINALKEINARYDVDIWEKNADAYKSKISVHEANDSETLRLNYDDSLEMSNDEIHLAKTKNLDRMDQLFGQSSSVSVGIQTGLNRSPFLKNDSERDSDLKKISRSSETVGTQTSPRCNKNVTEIGCNTTPSKSFCKDAAISCDLINWTNLRTNLTIENNRSMTEDVPIHEIKFSSVEDEDFHENKEFLTSECKEALNAETSSKSENYFSTKAILPDYNNITAVSSIEIDTIRDFTTDLTMEKIHKEKASQNKIYLESSKHCNEWMNTTDEFQESTKCFKDHEVNNDPINNLSSGSNDKLLSVESCSLLKPVYNYDLSRSSSSEALTEYLENDAQYNEMNVPEFKLEDTSHTLIAAFQLAAERARNLYEAVILYKENLMTRAFEEQNEKAIENQTSSKDQHIQNKASFEFCDNGNEVRSVCESECQFIMKKNEYFDVLSTCSSNSSDSDQMYEPKLQSSEAHQIDSEIGRAEMSAALPREEEATANLILNKRIKLVLANVKSVLYLLVRRMRERHTSEILEVERPTESDDENLRSESETSEASILPVIKEIKTISQQLLFLLICCAVIILAHWYLHFSFTFYYFP